MALIIAIDVLVVVSLLFITLTRGLERALPLFVFVTVFLPDEAQFQIPGLFGVTGRRVAVATLALLYLLFKERSGNGLVLKKAPLTILMLVHVIWCLVSTADSVVPLFSFKKMLYMVIEYYAMYYILVRSITRTETVHRIIHAMVFAVSLACIFGALEAYSNWRVIDFFPRIDVRFGSGGGSDRGRFYSTFTDYSLFGGAVSFAVVEALYLLTLARNRMQKLYLWAAVLLMFLNIYKVVTRGPWLSLVIGFVLVFFIGDSINRKRMLAIGVLTAVILAANSGVRDTILDTYRATVHAEDPENPKAKSYQYRYALWGVAVDALRKSPARELWGYGLESFYYLHLRAPFYNNPEYPYESCDSSWVEVTVETGFLGLLLMALLLFKPALLTFRDWRSLPKPDSYLSGILFINMVQYFLMMFNVAIYSWGQTAYMLWMWIAMAMVYKSVLARRGALTTITPQAPLPRQPQFAANSYS